jgi:hypothetical protein
MNYGESNNDNEFHVSHHEVAYSADTRLNQDRDHELYPRLQALEVCQKERQHWDQNEQDSKTLVSKEVLPDSKITTLFVPTMSPANMNESEPKINSMVTEMDNGCKSECDDLLILTLDGENCMCNYSASGSIVSIKMDHSCYKKLIIDIQTHSSNLNLRPNVHDENTALTSNIPTRCGVDCTPAVEFVKDHRLYDVYGESGKYTGVILQSTDMPHGIGSMDYDDHQTSYNGEWRNGQWHGSGRATFPNGDSYEGEYACDQRHGQGKYVWSDGRVYEGEFHHDKGQGRGIFSWPDGAKYIGEFYNGQREGNGYYTFLDAGYYNGSWKNSQFDGYGGKGIL